MPHSPLEFSDISVTLGRAIVLNSPAECQILRRACVLPNAWSRLNDIATAMQSGIPVSASDLGQMEQLSPIETSWAELIDGQMSPLLAWPNVGPTPAPALDAGSGLIHLFAALRDLQETWQGDHKVADLQAVLCLPETLGGDAEIVLDDAALVFKPGSVDAFVGWKLAYRGSGWVLGMCMRRGRQPSQIAKDIVNDLRARRITPESLPTTEATMPAVVAGKHSVIVFLHGLMSVDAGLFDEFVSALKEDSHFDDDDLMLVYPHDTFAPLRANAEELVREIEFLFDKQPKISLAFVCHSRGGLLARLVATKLYRSNPERWRERLVGCVTFGTPHLGTPLAENPERLLGAGVTAIRATQPGGFMGASDVLALVSAYRGNIPGVQDLKPPSAIDGTARGVPFLSELGEEERLIAGQLNCRLRVLAIGGSGPHPHRLRWLTEKLFRGAPNDCAVELASSAPERLVDVTPEEVVSDHFSYFSGHNGFEAAAAFLKERLTPPFEFRAGLTRDLPVGKPITFRNRTDRKKP
ncbi:MAG: hypothetical protein ABJE47_12895 [bacterium]